MGDCSRCGKKAMTFTCRYCGEKFCSEHRLPENHNCGGLDEEVQKEKEQSKEKWFEEKESKDEQETRTVTASTRSTPGLGESIVNTLKSNYTLSIILVTVIAFFMQYLVPGFSQLLVLDPNLVSILYRPWTLVTVMLLHGGLFHLLANMITFYFFGTPVEKAVGGKELLKMYVGAGIVASLGFVGFRNLLSSIYGPEIAAKTLFGMQFASMDTLGLAVGASGAVVAFVGAVAMLYPEAEVLLYFVIPMKIKTAVYAFGGLEAFNLMAKLLGYSLPVIGNFASSAHLAGLLIGLWYGRKLRDRHRKRTSVFNPLSH